MHACIPREGCWSPVAGSRSGPGVGWQNASAAPAVPSHPRSCQVACPALRKTTTLPQLTLLSGQHDCREALDHLFLQKASSAEVSPLAGAVTVVI